LPSSNTVQYFNKVDIGYSSEWWPRLTGLPAATQYQYFNNYSPGFLRSR
jgi:hypothetical protein